MKHGARNFAILGSIVLTSAIALNLAAGAGATTFPSCPSQTQLLKRGATQAEVSGAPQMSTGQFPLTQQLMVPDEQCIYPGSFGLILAYWKLTAAQREAAAQHLAYECKTKGCKVFSAYGSHTTSVMGKNGKTSTSTEPTLIVTVLSGSTNGDASLNNPPKAKPSCDEFADFLYEFLVGATPKPATVVCP